MKDKDHRRGESSTAVADPAPTAPDDKQSGPHAMATDSGEGDQPDKGERVVSRKTIFWAVSGLLIGSFIGWGIGLSFGLGRLNIPGLAPMVAGGAGVPGFIFASFFAALFGLMGALLGTMREARAESHKEETHQGDTRHKQSGQSSFVGRLPTYGAAALALFMLYTLYDIASRGYGSGAPSDQSNRVTWNQKNVARVGGASDTETVQYVLQTAFPVTGAENRPRRVANVIDDWRVALAMVPLMARPTSAAVVISTDAGTDPTTSREIERLRAAPAGGSIPAATPTPVAPGPTMQMPTGDDITMWATLLMSVAVGFLAVLPFNYWMVERGTKMGMM